MQLQTQRGHLRFPHYQIWRAGGTDFFGTVTCKQIPAQEEPWQLLFFALELQTVLLSSSPLSLHV